MERDRDRKRWREIEIERDRKREREKERERIGSSERGDLQQSSARNETYLALEQCRGCAIKPVSSQHPRISHLTSHIGYKKSSPSTLSYSASQQGSIHSHEDVFYTSYFD